MDDRTYMNMALELAERGWGDTSPNPMVGAVVVRQGRVVGRGYHRAVGQAHAEVNALADAGDSAEGATLYVTLEPCNHTGRTPPCTAAILKAGIRRVVVAMLDPNPDVAGGGCRLLQRRGVEVGLGVCRRQAESLNEAFIKFVKTKLPFVTLKCAATLDGRIATRTGDARWVSGPASREYVHHLRHGMDGILVGINTVRMDDPRLTARPADRAGRDPVRIILDTNLSISETAAVLRLDSVSDTIVVCKDLWEPGQLDRSRAAIERKGVRILPVPLADGRIDLNCLMTQLGRLGITSLLIEGGSRVIAAAFSAGIVDKVIFFYGPKILGGDDGFPVCRGAGPERMADALRVRDLEVRRFDEDVMVSGYPLRNGRSD